jgi:uroporphyrinogen decarboxylase
LNHGEGKLAAINMTHRELIEKCLNGDTTAVTPVAMWRHFPVDDQTPDDLARSVIGFQRSYDFDLVKVTPASSFCIKDWGVEDEWQGNPEGTRQYIRKVIFHPEDWLKLSILDPKKGYLGEQLKCLGLICQELGADVPVLQTIFSPLAQAKNLAGNEMLLVHLRQYPEAVLEGLKAITESTRRFIEAANKTGTAGYFYAVQHANYQLLCEEEYAMFGRTFDLEILGMTSDKWLNMLHLHGNHVMFNMFSNYPVQIINWHDRETYPSLQEGKELFAGVVCGGLQRTQTMELGTPEKVRAEAEEAIKSTGNQRFILGTGCVLQTTSPRANIIAAKQAAGRE